MALVLPPVPNSLRNIQHYLKTASEHEARDPVLTYWCRLFALQAGLKCDNKSDDATNFLFKLMDWLEVQKKALADNEAVTNDIAAQAHVENYALSLFHWADTQDRAGSFDKNVVKAFYTAGMLMDVLTTFGPLDEDIAANCKYAKWKAAYIHNCLKNGETPVPGPATGGEADQDGQVNRLDDGLGLPGASSVVPPRTASPPSDSSGFVAYRPPPGATAGVNPGASDSVLPSTADLSLPSTTGGSAVVLDPTQIAKAQKYCKFAGSALNYDDVPEAISCLEKALRLLKTGVDS